MTHVSPKSLFNRQIAEATEIRKFAYSMVQGKHDGQFARKDYIGLSLFNRCLQIHQAAETVVTHSLIDDAWILVRSLVEHTVNCVYMLHVADPQTANDYSDYADYLSYTTLLDLKTTDEEVLRRSVSAEEEEALRLRYEAVRSRFDGKRGDKWCADYALYKRAAHIDRAHGCGRSDYLWLVNSVWRNASVYTHGTSGALGAQLGEEGQGVTIHRKPTHREAAEVLHCANFALYLGALPVDVRLGGKNATELNRRLAQWAADIGPS